MRATRKRGKTQGTVLADGEKNTARWLFGIFRRLFSNQSQSQCRWSLKICLFFVDSSLFAVWFFLTVSAIFLFSTFFVVRLERRFSGYDSRSLFPPVLHRSRSHCCWGLCCGRYWCFSVSLPVWFGVVHCFITFCRCTRWYKIAVIFFHSLYICPLSQLLLHIGRLFYPLSPQFCSRICVCPFVIFWIFCKKYMPFPDFRITAGDGWYTRKRFVCVRVPCLGKCFTYYG